MASKFFFFFLACSPLNCFSEEKCEPLIPKLSTYELKNLFAQTCIPSIQKNSYSVTVDLMNPYYSEGVLNTEDGGVVKGEDFYLQAQKIKYTYTSNGGVLVHQIQAEGNILLHYQGRVFVGKKIFFNFVTGQGVIEEGRTLATPFYVSSKKIYVFPNKKYQAIDASLTSCEHVSSSWDIHAKKICVENKYLDAKGVRFRFLDSFSLPLPSFYLNLEKEKQYPLLQYQVLFEKWRPRISFRYQAYSWEEFFLFLRLDYLLPEDAWKNSQWQKGFGGAIETEYFSKDKKSFLLTRNYIANDILIDEPHQKLLYRLQGEGSFLSNNEKTTGYISWDKFSDIKMSGDFDTEDFEVNPRKRNELLIRHKENYLITSLYVHPRLNPFETINQDLPTYKLLPYPLFSKDSKIISDNWLKTSYLNLEYSNDLDGALKDYDSIRLQNYHNIYRNFSLGPVSITPNTGISGIFYSNTPKESSKGIGLFFYGLDAHTEVYKCYDQKKHIIRPYITYQQLFASSNPNSHFIFSLDDGYNNFSELKSGIKNLIYSKENTSTWIIDLYALAFFDQNKIQTVQKLYCSCQWLLPYLDFTADTAYDFEHSTLDHSNFLSRLTVNEDLAFSLEFRYRSKFCWRKSDYTNYFVDITRNQNDLLLSPLSDRRISLLTNIFFRLSPFWACHIQSHHGFYREKMLPFNEFKIDLLTSLSTFWKVTLSFEHTEGGNQWSVSYKLIK